MPSRFGSPRGSLPRILKEAGEIADARMQATQKYLDDFTTADDPKDQIGGGAKLSRQAFVALLRQSPDFRQQVANRWVFANADERAKLLETLRQAFPDQTSGMGLGPPPSPIPSAQTGTGMGGPPQGAGPVGPQPSPGGAPGGPPGAPPPLPPSPLPAGGPLPPGAMGAGGPPPGPPPLGLGGPPPAPPPVLPPNALPPPVPGGGTPQPPPPPPGIPPGLPAGVAPGLALPAGLPAPATPADLAVAQSPALGPPLGPDAFLPLTYTPPPVGPAGPSLAAGLVR